MSDFSVYVYGNGDLYYTCFNAIAATMGSNAYDTLLRMAGLCAGYTAMFSFTTKQDFMMLVRWFGVLYMCIFMLFVPKATVDIIDRVNVGTGRPVANVPLGLAMMASYSSTIGDALTQFLDSTFSMPNDLKYTKTGMVMASRMVVSANDFQITDSEFNSNIQEFMHQCVFYDLLLHKYTLNDLMRAPNAWDFIKANTSKARAFSYNGQVTICRDGAHTFGASWSTIVDNVAKQYGAHYFPGDNDPGGTIKSTLLSSYQFLLKNLSSDQNTIFSQHLMKNLIERGVINMDGSLDANAALQTYAYTRGMDQQRITFSTIGEMVGSWIQYFKNAVEIITYALFIFVILMAIFPNGIKVLRNYVVTLMWLQFWAPIYVVINLIISFYAKASSSGITSGVLSLEAIPAILQANADMAGIAGYLTIMVPAISWGLVKGVESTFGHMNHSFGGLMQSSIGSGVAEATTGNFSFANTNIGNHSVGNNNGFHWDTSGRFTSGMMQTQLSNGSMMTNMADGHAMVDVRPTISNIGASVDIAGSTRKGLSTMAEKSTTASMSQSRASAENYTQSARELYELASQLGYSEGSSDSWTLGTNAGHAKAYKNAMQLTERFANDHKISFGEAEKVLSSAYGEISGGIGMQGGIPIPVKGGASAGWRRVSDHSTSHEKSNLYDQAKAFVKDSGYSESVDFVERAAKDHQLKFNNEESKRAAENMSASFDRAESYRSESINSMQKAESYRQAANEAQEHVVGYRQTMDQKLAEYIAHQPHPDGSGKIGMSRLSDVVSNPELLNRYAERFVQDNADKFMPKQDFGLPSSAKSISQTFGQNNLTIGNSEKIHRQFENNKSHLNENAEKVNLTHSHVDDSIKSQAEKKITGSKHDLNIKKINIKREGHTTEAEYYDQL